MASLRVSVEAARQRGECVDHVLLYGPPGLGKTTLAGILANEMGTNLVTTAGPAIERGADLMGILTNLATNDVLFIDEVHRLPRAVEELLYPAMEDFAVNFVIDKGLHARTLKYALRPFTLVAATTRPGMLSAPLRERFGIFHHLDFYSEAELTRIVTRSADDPRRPHRSGRRARDRPPRARHAAHREPPAAAGARLRAGERRRRGIGEAVARDALDREGVDARGLDRLDRRFLGAHRRASTAAARSGIEAVAATINDDAETLSRAGGAVSAEDRLLARSRADAGSRREAYAHLGKPPPAATSRWTGRPV